MKYIPHFNASTGKTVGLTHPLQLQMASYERFAPSSARQNLSRMFLVVGTRAPSHSESGRNKQIKPPDLNSPQMIGYSN